MPRPAAVVVGPDGHLGLSSVSQHSFETRKYGPFSIQLREKLLTRHSRQDHYITAHHPSQRDVRTTAAPCVGERARPILLLRSLVAL
jgi:hypothetical protein